MTYHVHSIALSDKGWTSNFIVAQWFEKCFLPQAKARNSSGKTILLIYDGHQSHETIELCEMVIQHDIQLYHLLAHTLHCLQPLDIGIFGPLQRAWQNWCTAAMDNTGKGITRQQVVKEYMTAHTKSFKETTILSTWKKSRILPFNPEIFTSKDFGPSIPSLFKAPLPKSFPVQFDDSDSDSSGDHVSVDNGSESEEENNEDDASEEEVAHVDHLNQDTASELPFSAQATTITNSSLPSPLSPLSLDAPTQLMQHCLSHEEGGGPPTRMDLPTHSSTTGNTHCYNFHCQSSLLAPTSQSVSQPSPPVPPQSVDERLAASEKRNEELQYELEKLKAHCALSGSMVNCLQKKLNCKETKKLSSARVKKTTGEARVLMSEEGCQELQQL